MTAPVPPEGRPSEELPAAALLCTAGMVIVGGSVAVSALVVDFPVLSGQAARYAIGTACLVALLWLRKERIRRTLTVPDWLRLTALSATGLAAFNYFILRALRDTDAAMVGTVIGCAPLLFALLGPLQARTRPSVRLLVAAGAAVAGAALVHGGGDATATGLTYAAGALAGEVAFTMLAAPLLPKLGPVRLSAYCCAIAVPLLAAGGVIAGELPHLRLPTATEAIVFVHLGLMMTALAFVLWYAGVARLGVARAGMFVALMPVSALAAQAALSQQWPTPTQTAGVLLVAAGLALGLSGRTRQPQISADQEPDNTTRQRQPAQAC